jgi:cytochrome c oxidase subunit 1/cytochrome c oxidase subunit I+III
MLDAEPEVILKMPGDSYSPLLLALAMTAVLVGMLLHSRWVCVTAVVISFIVSTVWLWPERRLMQIENNND